MKLVKQLVSRKVYTLNHCKFKQNILISVFYSTSSLYSFSCHTDMMLIHFCIVESQGSTFKSRSLCEFLLKDRLLTAENLSLPCPFAMRARNLCLPCMVWDTLLDTMCFSFCIEIGAKQTVLTPVRFWLHGTVVEQLEGTKPHALLFTSRLWRLGVKPSIGLLTTSENTLQYTLGILGQLAGDVILTFISLFSLLLCFKFYFE